MGADALIKKFVNLNYVTAKKKNFTIKSIFNSLSKTRDLNRYYFNYLIDNVPVEIGTKFNLTSRRQFLEYYRQKDVTNLTAPVFPLKDGNSLLNYMDFSNNEDYRAIDQITRTQNPSLLGNALITQVDSGKLPENKTTYHIVYMANGKYY